MKWLDSTQGRAAALVALLAIHAILIAWQALTMSPTVDEVGHLAAGLYTWRSGRTDLYHVNPPTARTIAAVPLLFLQPNENWQGYAYGGRERPEWTIGRDFIIANPGRYREFFALGRLMLLPISLLGLGAAWIWATELYGPRAGFAAGTLWAFEPSLTANAAIISSDAFAASVGVAAHYCLWKHTKNPTWSTTSIAACGLGVLLMSKFTWLAVIPLWLGLPLLVHLSRGKPASELPRIILKASLVLFGGLILFNASYGFAGTGQSLGTGNYYSALFAGETTDEAGRSPQSEPDASRRRTGNRLRDSWLEHVPSPLPADALAGIDLQRLDFEKARPCYLNGELQRRGPWWFYLYGLSIKSTTGMVFLAALWPIVAWTSRRSGFVPWAIVLTAAAVFALLSSQTGMMIYMRYALPLVALAIVPLASIGRRLFYPSCIGWLVTACLFAHAAESAITVPHQLSFFNTISGGTNVDPPRLIDSNLDWGQDVHAALDWIDSDANLDDRGNRRTAVFVSAAPTPIDVLVDEYPGAEKVGGSALYFDGANDRDEIIVVISRDLLWRQGFQWAKVRDSSLRDRIGGSFDAYVAPTAALPPSIGAAIARNRSNPGAS